MVCMPEKCHAHGEGVIQYKFHIAKQGFCVLCKGAACCPDRAHICVAENS